MINNYKRYQTGLTLECLYPTLKDVCACGCGNALPPRKKKWYSKECQRMALYNFYVVKGDNQFIRKVLFEQQQGHCQICGVYDEYWEADHKIAVHKGGGGCCLDNFQTLCKYCHSMKTLNRLPDSCDVLTPSLNVLSPSSYGFGALSKSISEYVIR